MESSLVVRRAKKLKSAWLTVIKKKIKGIQPRNSVSEANLSLEIIAAVLQEFWCCLPVGSDSSWEEKDFFATGKVVQEETHSLCWVWKSFRGREANLKGVALSSYKWTFSTSKKKKTL